MAADLNKPFNPSCCDGGECSTNDMSCQPCGCDKGANWVCQVHQIEAEVKRRLDESARETPKGSRRSDVECGQ